MKHKFILQDDYINEALVIHEGDSIPGFPSADAFFYLLKPELEKLKDPIYDTLTEVFGYLEMLSTKILEKTFMRFPRLIDDVNEFVSKFLNEVKNKQLIVSKETKLDTLSKVLLKWKLITYLQMTMNI